jgi:peptide-methionine (R)-S-oxide reductase
MMQSRRDFARFALAAATGFVALKGSIQQGKAAAATEKFKVVKSDEEWRKILTPEQYDVLRKQGTEPPETSPLDANDAPGIYDCAACALPLFSSETKFHSGTGWPSFWKPLDNAVGTSVDETYLMARTEVHCRRCGGHLGHVFKDGPKPTGLRYCMNGVAMAFKPADKP